MPHGGRSRSAVVDEEEDEIAAADEAMGLVEKADHLLVFVVKVGHSLGPPLHEQGDIDFVLKALDMSGLGTGGDLSEARQFHDPQVLDLGVGEGALDSDIPHGQVRVRAAWGLHVLRGRISDERPQVGQLYHSLLARQVRLI
jgi:hypothetical protein